jgi:hypothetical protein
VPRQVDAQGSSCRAEARTDDGSEAEAGVHERHQGLADLALDRRAFDVHHDVDHPVAETEHREAETDDGYEVEERHASADQHHAGRDDDESDDHPPVGADFREQGSGCDESEDGADGHPEDQQPDLRRVQSEPVADSGDARYPGRQAEPAEDEDDEHRVAPGREFASAVRCDGRCRLRHDVLMVRMWRDVSLEAPSNRFDRIDSTKLSEKASDFNRRGRKYP